MSAPVLYSDSLVEITDDSILFRGYYFPFGAKRIKVSEIGGVSAHKPALSNGKYRLHGGSGLRTWFPRDLKRPFRDKIFIATMPHKWLRVGFTVEDSDAVERILRDKGLLTTVSRAA